MTTLESNELPALPDGWEWMTLDKVADAQAGTGFPEKYQGLNEGDFPFVKVSDISMSVKEHNGLLKVASNYVSADVMETLRAKVFPLGTTLFAKIGEAVKLNRRALVQVPCLADNNVMGLIPKAGRVEQKYLHYFMHTIQLGELSRATTVPSVRKGDIEAILIPLAPLEEQRRIVAAIEVQFSRLDESTAVLKRLQRQSQRYRAALLKHACEGQLLPQDPTDEPADQLLQRILHERRQRWETANAPARPSNDTWKQKYRPPVPPDTADLPELPSNWTWATMDMLAETVSGVTKGKNLEGKETVELPYLRVANVQMGYLDLSVIKKIIAEPTDLEKYALKKGDLLSTEGGDWDKLGRSAIWQGQVKDCIHQNHIYRARPYLNHPSSTWLMYVTNSEHGRKYFANSAKQTTNLASINLTQLRACPIPLPPMKEQKRILEEVERRLTLLDALDHTLATTLQRANRLRQAILQRAFTGQLVPPPP